MLPVLTLLLTLSLILIGIHYGTPLFYFGYLRKHVNDPWRLETDIDLRPRAVVIVPAYNEEQMIASKLDDIANQTYPRDHFEIIVTDDGSNDRTKPIASEWMAKHAEVKATLRADGKHGGKMPMVRRVLASLGADTDVVVLTDVDAYWNSEALTNMSKYFGDKTVAAVTGSIQYSSGQGVFFEKNYRTLYNAVRIAESKLFATPIFNGPFAALRMRHIREYGLPDFEGIDDSALASYFALAGLRCIQVDDVKVAEPHRGSLWARKTRRANRLVLTFMRTKKSARRHGLYKRTAFEKIWRMEWWLTLVNPWLLFTGAIVQAVLVPEGQLLALLPLILGVAALVYTPYRTWMTQQLYLAVGMLRNLRTRDVTWRT